MISHAVIPFKGMPLFVKARFNSMEQMQGEISDFACFFYMTEGTMRTFDARGVHQVDTREAVMKQCGNYIQRYIAADGQQECEAIAVYLYPELLKAIYKDEIPSFLAQDGTSNPPKKYIANRLIEQYMSNLSIYFEQPEALDEELGVLKLKELMMILLKSENHQDIRQMLSDIFTPVDLHFRQAVEANLFNDISMEELAFICNMSLSTFKREFKRTFDQTPAKYIKGRRLQHAARLLLTTDQSVTSIAYDSGFQDITTFSANFSTHFQTSPSKYRLTQNSK